MSLTVAVEVERFGRDPTWWAFAPTFELDIRRWTPKAALTALEPVMADELGRADASA